MIEAKSEIIETIWSYIDAYDKTKDIGYLLNAFTIFYAILGQIREINEMKILLTDSRTFNTKRVVDLKPYVFRSLNDLKIWTKKRIIEIANVAWINKPDKLSKVDFRIMETDKLELIQILVQLGLVINPMRRAIEKNEILEILEQK